MLSHLQQTAFENIVAKGEIAQKEQSLLLPQSFEFFSVIIPSFSVFRNEFYMLSKSSAGDTTYVGKGLT